MAIVRKTGRGCVAMLGAFDEGCDKLSAPSLAGWVVRRQGMNEPLARRLEDLSHAHRTVSRRGLSARVRFHEGWTITKKAVPRLVNVRGWSVDRRTKTARPRVQGWVSRAAGRNQRWAVDVTRIPCGADGWVHRAAIIDCHYQNLIGRELALRARAEEAGYVSQVSCPRCLGKRTFVLSDNGLTSMPDAFAPFAATTGCVGS